MKQSTSMWLFPHQQAEKSLQNQHVLSILQVGSHQLQYRFFRTNKPKSHHKTNTFCPITQETHPAADHDRAAYTKILRAPGSAPLSLLHSCPGEVRMIPSRGGPAPSIHVFAPRAQPRRGTAHHHRPAPPKTCSSTVGPHRGLAGLRADAPSEAGLKDKKSWWRVSPSCFGGGLCGGGRARRWRRPIWG